MCGWSLGKSFLLVEEVEHGDGKSWYGDESIALIKKRRSEYPELPAVFAFIRASRFWGIAEIWMTFKKICTFCLKGMTFQGMIQVLSWGRLPGCPMDPIPHKAPFGWLSKCSSRLDFRGGQVQVFGLSLCLFGIPLNIFKLQSPSSLSKLLAFYALSK